MTPANTTRQHVMLSAWRTWRATRTVAKPASFGKCLKKAWVSQKRLAKACGAFLARAAANGGKASFGSPIHSPTSRSMSGETYRGFADGQAGRQISRLGR